MNSTWLVARSHLRSRRLGLISVALVTAVAGAVALTALAGARRTSTALERALDEVRYPDVTIDIADLDPEKVAQVEALPQVAEAAISAFAAVRPAGTELVAGIDVVGVLPVDDEAYSTIAALRMSEGRIPAPDRPDEIALGPDFAASLGVGIGDRLTLEAYSQDQVAAIFSRPEGVEPSGATFEATVVGTGRGVNDLVTDQSGDFGVIVLSPSAFEKFGAPGADFSKPVDSELGVFRLNLMAVLEDGVADRARLLRDLSSIYGENVITTFSEDREDLFRDASETVRVEAIALLIFAFAAGAAGLLTTGQMAARQITLAATPSREVLRTLGFSRRQRSLSVLLPVAIAITVGVAISVGAAIGASALLPRGLAGIVEPDPGIRVDPPVLAAGAVVLTLLLIGRAGIAAWGATAVAEDSVPTAGGWSTRLSSPSAWVGIRMAFQAGRGATKVPTRPALAAAIVGVVGVVASLTFAVSLDHLVDTPRLYGNDWDARITLQARGAAIGKRESPRLVADERLAAVALYGLMEASFEGQKRVAGVGIDVIKGDIGPTLLSGRMPEAPDEVALDPGAIKGSGPAVGDMVSVRPAQGNPMTLKVVGELTGTGLSTFAVTPATAEALGVSEFDEYGVLVRWSRGVEPTQVLASLRERFAEVDVPQPPETIANLDRVRSFPYLLAGFLALLAVAGMGHLLVSAVRRRGRDLAVLKVLGFSRGQLRAAVAWQGSAVVIVGLLVGIPLGIAAGRGIWTLLAESLRVVNDPIIPISIVGAIGPAAVLVANLVAAVPGAMAARTRPAVVLRAE